MTAGGSDQWQNWARTERSHPARRGRPRDQDELAALVRTAGDLRVRAVGARHSSSAAAVTDGLLLHLDALTGIEHVTRHSDGTADVTARAGTRLGAPNRALDRLGLALHTPH